MGPCSSSSKNNKPAKPQTLSTAPYVGNASQPQQQVIYVPPYPMNYHQPMNYGPPMYKPPLNCPPNMRFVPNMAPNMIPQNQFYFPNQQQNIPRPMNNPSNPRPQGYAPAPMNQAQKVQPQASGLNRFLQFVEALEQMVGVCEGKHMGVSCDSCGKRDFKGFRYKCLECKDYDLCDLCFEKKKCSKSHSISHPMLLLQDPNLQTALEPLVEAGLEKVHEICVEQKIVHDGVFCNGCKSENIQGIRFLCDYCLDYDLCFKCHKQKKQTEQHLTSHPMIAMLAPNNYTIAYDEIEWHEQLGEGSFGKAYKAVWKGKVIACKVLDFSLVAQREDKENQFLAQQIVGFQNERKIYKELCSKNIIRYIGEANSLNFMLNSIGDCQDIGTKMVICLEFMENGTVWDQILKKKIDLSLRKRFQLCLGLASGLRRIHSKKIVHKDLKPDNIFLTKDWELKIGDLGLAFNKKLSSELKDLKQQLYYPIEEKVSMAGDVYSAGVIINEIFTGTIHNFKIFFDIEPKSKFFFDIVVKCLQQDPDSRPLAEQIEDRFLIFDDFFWKFLNKKNIKYTEGMSNEEKNKIFIVVYNSFVTEFGVF